MRARTVARVDRLRDAVGVGCPRCRDRPAVHLLGEDDPTPAAFCLACGRRFDEDVYVYLGIDPATI